MAGGLAERARLLREARTTGGGMTPAPGSPAPPPPASPAPMSPPPPPVSPPPEPPTGRPEPAPPLSTASPPALSSPTAGISNLAERARLLHEARDGEPAPLDAAPDEVKAALPAPLPPALMTAAETAAGAGAAQGAEQPPDFESWTLMKRKQWIKLNEAPAPAGGGGRPPVVTAPGAPVADAAAEERKRQRKEAMLAKFAKLKEESGGRAASPVRSVLERARPAAISPRHPSATSAPAAKLLASGEPVLRGGEAQVVRLRKMSMREPEPLFSERVPERVEPEPEPEPELEPEAEPEPDYNASVAVYEAITGYKQSHSFIDWSPARVAGWLRTGNPESTHQPLKTPLLIQPSIPRFKSGVLVESPDHCSPRAPPINTPVSDALLELV